MMDLEILRKHREALWRVELAGWLHNIGKMTEAFRDYQINVAKNYQLEYVSGSLLARFGTDSHRKGPALGYGVAKTARKATVPSLAVLGYTSGRFERESGGVFERIFELKIDLPAPLRVSFTVGELIELQDSVWHHGPTQLLYEPSLPLLPFLISISHQQASGQDKVNLDREVEESNTKTGQRTTYKQVERELDRHSQSQKGKVWRRSTAFGYEEDLDLTQYPKACREAAELIESRADRVEIRSKLYQILNAGIADSRRPIHDLRIGDMGKMVAAFAKAQAAKMLLTETGPGKDGWLWRLARIAFDGPTYVEQASRIPDILARRSLVHDWLDEVRGELEDEAPLGNEVYRDEYGAVYAMADFAEATLREWIEEAIRRIGKRGSDASRIAAEVQYQIQVGPPFAMGPMGEKSFQLGPLLDRALLPAAASPEALRSFWKSTGGREVCSVCALRPVADKFTERHAFGQRACVTCFDRRVGSSRKWLADRKYTIWLDEVADANGRLGLIVGRLRLEQWLKDGGAIERTLVLAKTQENGSTKRHMKGASAARIARVWETARQFWADWNEAVKEKQQIGGRWRLRGQLPDQSYRPGQAFLLIPESGALRGIKISAVYEAGSTLMVADNLERLAGLAGERIVFPTGQRFRMEEPTGYGSADQFLGLFEVREAEWDGTGYAPIRPLLADPMLMMTLVPGNRAMEYVQDLRRRCEEQMGKVRGQLGLDLGLIWAPAETPVHAILNAGRRMMKRNPAAERAIFQSRTGERIEFAEGFTIVVPDDSWFSNFETLAGELKGVGELTPGDVVRLEPSTFDYEFLESASRRFELAYDGEQRRLSMHAKHRPYRLEDLDLWSEARGILEKYLGLGTRKAKIHQLKALDGLLESKRQLWGCSWDGIDDGFVRWALLNVEWGKDEPTEEEYGTLVQATRRGIFADLLEVELGIRKAGREKETAHAR